MSLYALDLPAEVLEEIRAVAQAKQLSVEEWFLGTIAQKLEAEKRLRLFQEYSQKADFERFDQILSRVPDQEPVPGDELV
jgi:hypothetical protein